MLNKPSESVPSGNAAKAFSQPRTQRQKLVIVGNGMTAHYLCEELVKHGSIGDYDIKVFGDEPYHPYNRIEIASVLEGHGIQHLFLREKRWYEKHGIHLHASAPIVGVDFENQIVLLHEGQKVFYDKLVIATGAKPFIPPIAGLDRVEYQTFTNLQDVQNLSKCLPGREMIIVGGGLIGIEAADALVKKGHRVTVIEKNHHILPKYIDGGGACLVQQHLQNKGIRFLTDCSTTRVVPDGDKIRLEFQLPNHSSQTLSCDKLVIASGIKPRTNFLEKTDMHLLEHGGIVVNQFLATNQRNVFAIGDCASYENRTVGLLTPGIRMAATLARQLSDQRAAFQHKAFCTRLKISDLNVMSVGIQTDKTNSLQFTGTNCYRKLFVDSNNRLKGFISIGEFHDDLEFSKLLPLNRLVDSGNLASFQKTGLVWANSAPLHLCGRDLVCHCKSVSVSQIRANLLVGKSKEEIIDLTGASTVCGSCSPLLARITQESDPDQSLKNIIPAILPGLFLLLLFMSFGFVSFDSTWSWAGMKYHIYSALESQAGKQWTGFTLVGICCGLALFPLLKRKNLLNLKFPSLVLIHLFLGLLAVVFLGVHASFSFGENLNQILFILFVGISGLGVFTEVLKGIGSESSLRLRPSFQKIHRYLSYPGAVILVIHIFVSYYF